MSNFHARDRFGANYPSKKSLREAVAAGDHVSFEDTSGFSNRGTVTWELLSPSDVIVGPCPYTKRSWYANVKKGKVV